MGHLQKGAPTDKRPLYRQGVLTEKGPLQTLCNSYRQRALTYNLGPLWTIKGPYRELGAYADKAPLHKCAPTDKRPLYRQGAHTDKGPYRQRTPQTLCNSYRKRALTDNLGPLQSNSRPYRQRTPQTLCNSYRQRALTDNLGPLQSNSGPLQTIPTNTGPYRQGTLTDKRPLQTRSQTRDPYRRCAISTDKRLLQTKEHYMIYMQSREGLLQTRAPASNGSYMIYR